MYRFKNLQIKQVCDYCQRILFIEKKPSCIKCNKPIDIKVCKCCKNVICKCPNCY